MQRAQRERPTPAKKTSTPGKHDERRIAHHANADLDAKEGATRCALALCQGESKIAKVAVAKAMSQRNRHHSRDALTYLPNTCPRRSRDRALTGEFETSRRKMCQQQENRAIKASKR